MAEPVEQEVACNCHCGAGVGGCNVTASYTKGHSAGTKGWSHWTVIAVVSFLELAVLGAYRYRHNLLQLTCFPSRLAIVDHGTSSGDIPAEIPPSRLLPDRADIVRRARAALASSR